MTKTIEFVEKEIEFCQLKINKAKEEKVYRETIAALFPENKNINLATVNEIEISLNEYKIKGLQQIKTELEAWEVCKKNYHINKYEELNKGRDKKCFDISIWLNTENCDFKSCASYEDILKVKKALEVEDE